VTCSSLALCGSCSPDYFLTPTKLCSITCPERFYANPVNQLCTPCAYHCYTCAASSSCLSCNATTDFRVLSASKCVPMPGYYESYSQVSSKCLSFCATCNSSANCMTCIPGYYLRADNLCYTSCLASFYADNASLTCRSCPTGCQLCVNLSMCTLCIASYYLRTDNLCNKSCPLR
jgi:proprotein convertase subtilisin/kexin type 5